MNPVAAAKREARAAALARRNALDAEARSAASEAVRERVKALPEWRGARTVAAYVPIGSEVDTRGLIADALAAGKRVAVPRTDRDGHDVVMHEIRDLAELKPGAFGVMEPDPGVHPDLAPGDVDLVIVPGITFDASGHRLGYGRGFFDRFLHGFPGFKVGVAFEVLVTPELPSEAHDEPVHAVVTEARVHRPGP